ncbi:hypothetical protein LPB67_16840 [Undibacterium sp. Jales W-56]|uniref:hypothetical protein n=1 Tax=Undibacterium sp. Jales W-56 TaxID=2897325 RepID=UPI0021D2F51F|nr:hypothetical protein [Undibacterium sp. Jales W-56]MCU6435446.1 hypothetical protein [Undibacterium sp. Jales W-56]
MKSRSYRLCCAALFMLTLSACESLLPNAKQTSDLPWITYQIGEQEFANIIPEKTTLADLHRRGINPKESPNIAQLNHADINRRLVASESSNTSLIPPKVRACLAAHTACYAYEIEEKHLDKKRYGNFFKDFLNFERKVQISGWQFTALIIIQNDVVVYKLWTGKSNIQQLEDEKNPLGPLQGLGNSLIHR